MKSATGNSTAGENQSKDMSFDKLPPSTLSATLPFESPNSTTSSATVTPFSFNQPNSTPILEYRASHYHAQPTNTRGTKWANNTNDTFPIYPLDLSSLNHPFVSYDTAKLLLLGNYDIHSSHPLDNHDDATIGRRTDTYIYRNFTINISPGHISVQGSLPKYLRGQNLEPFKLSEVNIIIEELSDVLGVGLKNSKVTRLDLSVNLLMDCEPYVYFPVLFDSPSSTRTIVGGNSLYFRNSMATLIFYDKCEEVSSEAGRHKRLLPQHVRQFLHDNHILRYECQSLRDKSIRESGVYAYQLSNPDIFRTFLIGSFKKRYDKITKMSSYLPLHLESINTHTLRADAHMEYVKLRGGFQRFVELLEASVRNGNINRSQKSRIKRNFCKSMVSLGDSYGQALLDELDSKIELACQNTMEMMI